MDKVSLKDLCVPMIKSIDSFNYLLKSHHRRTAIISYLVGNEMDLTNEQMVNLVIAASLHDIGALSVQERDSLFVEDVENPLPHCVMGYNMLKPFDVFGDIAKIIRYHHIKYEETDFVVGGVPIESHILHFADRIDILISPDKFIIDQKGAVREMMKNKTGVFFHPDVFDAFEKASKGDIFWISINNMSIEQLFAKIDFNEFHELDFESLVLFSQTISRIVDFRSKYTAAHSYTVAHLAYQLGKFLGVNDEGRNKLLVAGYLHDIGKIGIDPGIIEKEGKLTESEFNIIKLHSYYSGQILSELGNSEWFADIIKWAEHHHERADGSGYPYSLKSEDIDNEAIILGYADVISALMENRPYRDGLSLEDTFDLLESNFAEKLDLEMFEVIKKNKEKIGVIVERCHKEAFETYHYARMK